MQKPRSFPYPPPEPKPGSPKPKTQEELVRRDAPPDADPENEVEEELPA
jgi:hypothetical protein